MYFWSSHSPEFQRWCFGHPPEPAGLCWPSSGRGTSWETWCCISGCRRRPPTATLPDVGCRGIRHMCTSPSGLSYTLWPARESVQQKTLPAETQSPWMLRKRDKMNWEFKKFKNGIQFLHTWQSKEMESNDNNVLSTTEVIDGNDPKRLFLPH